MSVDPYQTVDESVVKELREICGVENVLYEDKARLFRYSHDQVAEKEYAHSPEVVVEPVSTEEVSKILKLAHRKTIPVTPRGAGSGLSGGCVPLHGGIVLSLARMNRIIEIDTENMIAVVEPGVVTNDLDDATREYGLFFAGYPMSDEFCYIGGNVAENAGGGRAIKYGVTGRYILGLEVVTARGEIVQIGGKRVKDVTGYDLVHLMVGSEGTLGVFTKIYVRLMPRPIAREVLLALFADVRAAVGTVPRIITRRKIIPTAIEFMDQVSFREACRLKRETLARDEIVATLLIEVDGVNPENVREEAAAIQAVCLHEGALEVVPARSEEEMERFWQIRKSVPWALKRFSPRQSLEDVVVPISRIPDVLEATREIAERHDVRIPCYGHAGDGNLHATPLMNPSHSEEHWRETLPKILTELYEAVSRLGGTISGEHGIGHKRKPYMNIVMSEVQLEMMRAIKRAFDPKNILNPGKIFDV